VRRFISPGFDPLEWIECIELACADVVESSSGPPVVPADPDDDPYLWTAYVGAASHVVTWDTEVLAVKHFRGAQIIDPARFLSQIRAR
jgi:predicted nucleic acid-binding protein